MMDTGLPGAGGWEVARRMRALPGEGAIGSYNYPVKRKELILAALTE